MKCMITTVWAREMYLKNSPFVFISNNLSISLGLYRIPEETNSRWRHYLKHGWCLPQQLQVYYSFLCLLCNHYNATCYREFFATFELKIQRGHIAFCICCMWRTSGWKQDDCKLEFIQARIVIGMFFVKHNIVSVCMCMLREGGSSKFCTDI